MTGREFEQLIGILERLTRAQERQVEVIEQELENQSMEGAPPSECPFCGQQNPVVTQTKLGSGPVDEFVLQAETHCCNKTVYAVAPQMLIVPNVVALRQFLEYKKGGMVNGSP